MAAAALVLGAAGCGGASPDPVRPSAAPCTDLPAADPAATLPADFPALPGQVLYRPAKQGRTTVVFGRVPGESFVALRDQVAADLTQRGYRLDGTDQEAVEAEVHFSSPREGSVRVKQLCAGMLEIRYRLSA
ncbi:MAG TPA: hypothetical protein VNA30_03135 [Mycobacteriales bacterium]|nr:hypothetical protein [Mycobacteriales bacterium]